MNQGQTIFSQIMSYIPKHKFDSCVKKYRGNYKVQSFSCWEQFLVMAFAQLTYRESLRDIETCLRAMQKNCTILAYEAESPVQRWHIPTKIETGEYTPTLLIH